MYLLNTGLPFAKLTVCMSNKELAGLSKMMKAYSTPFLDEASYKQKRTHSVTKDKHLRKVVGKATDDKTGCMHPQCPM